MVGMRTRSGVAAALAAGGLLIAGCSGSGSSGAPAPEPTPDLLTSFDPCSVLSPEEIQSFGASPEGEPADQELGEAGCDFKGGDFNFGVLKAGDGNEAYWQGQRAQFDKFMPNQVGDRAGFSGISAGGAGQGVCSQFIYVGKGSVIVDVTYRSDKVQGDEATCAKALEIAQVVEPKLPK
ncbi:hypothetical protein GCM10027597_16920 [Saccharopolyspora tripterygii]